MNKSIVLMLLFFVSYITAQEENTSVSKSTTSIQLGTVGLWINNEFKLTNQIALRSEIGVYTEIQKGVGYFIAPEINIEPRWYYNIEKRALDKKDVANNSANFFTIRTSYRSNVFEISDYSDSRAKNSILIIPKWGIKRNFGSHFNFEAGFGVGYQSYLGNLSSEGKSSEAIVDIHLRVGYTF